MEEVFQDIRCLYNTKIGEYKTTECFVCMVQVNIKEIHMFDCKKHYMCKTCLSKYYSTSFIYNNNDFETYQCFHCYMCNKCSCFSIDKIKEMPNVFTDDNTTQEDLVKLVIYNKKLLKIIKQKKIIEIVGHLLSSSTHVLDEFLKIYKDEDSSELNEDERERVFKILHENQF